MATISRRRGPPGPAARSAQERLVERAAIDALVALADKSEAGEVRGEFIDIRDEAHLDQLMNEILNDVLSRRPSIA